LSVITSYCTAAFTNFTGVRRCKRCRWCCVRLEWKESLWREVCVVFIWCV